MSSFPESAPSAVLDTSSKIEETAPTSNAHPFSVPVVKVLPSSSIKTFTKQCYTSDKLKEILKFSSRGTFTSLQVNIVPSPGAAFFISQIVGVFHADDSTIGSVREALEHPGHFSRTVMLDSMQTSSHVCDFAQLALSALVKPTPIELPQVQLTIFMTTMDAKSPQALPADVKGPEIATVMLSGIVTAEGRRVA